MNLEEFRKLVKDALEHLYDTAYLEVHPLLTQVAGVTTANRSTHAQALTGILKDAVENCAPGRSFGFTRMAQLFGVALSLYPGNDNRSDGK